MSFKLLGLESKMARPPIVMLNLFQHLNRLKEEILKLVQNDIIKMDILILRFGE